MRYYVSHYLTEIISHYLTEIVYFLPSSSATTTTNAPSAVGFLAACTGQCLRVSVTGFRILYFFLIKLMWGPRRPNIRNFCYNGVK